MRYRNRSFLGIQYRGGFIMKNVTIVITAAIFLVSSTLFAEVIHVPDHYPTIQAGIDAALDGDTVLVADGTYTGEGNRDIDFRGKAITVKSTNGANRCIIDNDYAESHRGFYFHSGEGEDSVLEGFTIRGGSVDDRGAGIYCVNSSPTIRNNNICRNGVGEWENVIGTGGGICCINASPIIANNNIYRNGAGYRGGGIYCRNSTSLIHNNRIYENIAHTDDEWMVKYGEGGGVYAEYSSIVISNNTFNNNHATAEGGAIAGKNNSALLITNNIITENSAGMLNGGRGNALFIGDNTEVSNNVITKHGLAWSNLTRNVVWCNGDVLFRNNTITGNDGGIYCDEGAALIIMDSIIRGNKWFQINDCWNSPALVMYSNIEGGWTGEGNIDADPLFVEGPRGEYYLSQIDAGQTVDSPSLNAGSDLAENICFVVGGGELCCNQLTTRTDQVADAGIVNMGYHYPIAPVTVELNCIPSWGTLPFTANIGVVLHNRIDSYRRFAASMSLEFADGEVIDNYRSGFQEMSPYERHERHWPFHLPDHDGYAGNNTIKIMVEDVTPAPFNQPPYVLSGDQETSICVMTGSRNGTVGGEIAGDPASGFLPFSSNICLDLDNKTDYHRRISYRVERRLADGSYDPNYRSGWNNVEPDGSHERCWDEFFPAEVGMVGTSTYHIYLADVTPAPYNQPPFPSSGDTATASCTIVGKKP